MGIVINNGEKNSIQISAHFKNQKSVINNELNIIYLTPCVNILNPLLISREALLDNNVNDERNVRNEE